MFTFNMFVILMALIVIAIAFFHYTQGFFTATISAILAIFSAVIAVSYHEMVVEKLLGGALADSANGAMVLLMFGVIYLILRTIFDQLIPGGLAMPAMVNKIGGAAMGVVAGVFAAGVAAFAGESMSFNPAILGYSRLPVEEASAMVPKSPNDKKLLSHPLYDYLSQNSNPLHEVDSTEQQKMYIPADDILIDTVMRLSDEGALSAGKPLGTMHPDWLMELFGQRLGIEPAGRRVALNNSKVTDVYAVKDASHNDAGVYLLDRPLTQKLGDFPSISKMRADLTKKFDFRPGKKSIAIVVRTYFGNKAKDTRDSLIRLSMGSVRICTERENALTGELEPFNYYPKATLEDAKEIFLQRPDDYLFVDDSTSSEGVTDKAIDLIFVVETPGFLEGRPVPPAPGDLLAWAVFQKKAKITEGTFIEVKRLGRVDLSGQSVQAFDQLKPRAAVAVLRKDQIKPPPEVALKEATERADLIRQFKGTWNMVQEDVATTLTISTNNNETGTLTKVVAAPGKQPVTTTGTWLVLLAKDGSLKIRTDTVTGTNKETTELSINFSNGGDSMGYVDANSNALSFDKKKTGGAATAGTPGTATPSTPTPNTPAPPPAQVQADQSLKVSMDTLNPNPNFYAQVSVPANAAGDVPVPGGTVNVDNKQFKAIKLDGAEDAKLRGQGEPIRRLGRADGTEIVQVDAVPGPAGANWAWKDKIEQLVAIDAKGMQYKCVGVWVITADQKISARFTASGQAATGDLTPAGTVQKIVLAFEVPEMTEIKKIQIGQAPVLGSGQ